MTLSQQNKLDLFLSLAELPSMSEVAARAMKLTDDPEATPNDIQEVVQTDSGLTSRILQVANSPLFSGVATTTTLSAP